MIAAAASLRNVYRRASALVAVVGHHLQSGLVEDVEEAVLGSGAMSCRAPDRVGEAQIS